MNSEPTSIPGTTLPRDHECLFHAPGVFMSRILIVGANGTVGSELGRLLAGQGQHVVVKATSRPPTAADQVQLDLVSRSGLHEAFDGVERAFLLSPPGHVNQHELLLPLIDEARSRGLKKVVL